MMIQIFHKTIMLLLLLYDSLIYLIVIHSSDFAVPFDILVAQIMLLLLLILFLLLLLGRWWLWWLSFLAMLLLLWGIRNIWLFLLLILILLWVICIAELRVRSSKSKTRVRKRSVHRLVIRWWSSSCSVVIVVATRRTNRNGNITSFGELFECLVHRRQIQLLWAIADDDDVFVLMVILLVLQSSSSISSCSWFLEFICKLRILHSQLSLSLL